MKKNINGDPKFKIEMKISNQLMTTRIIPSTTQMDQSLEHVIIITLVFSVN